MQVRKPISCIISLSISCDIGLRRLFVADQKVRLNGFSWKYSTVIGQNLPTRLDGKIGRLVYKSQIYPFSICDFKLPVDFYQHSCLTTYANEKVLICGSAQGTFFKQGQFSLNFQKYKSLPRYCNKVRQFSDTLFEERFFSKFK